MDVVCFTYKQHCMCIEFQLQTEALRIRPIQREIDGSSPSTSVEAEHVAGRTELLHPLAVITIEVEKHNRVPAIARPLLCLQEGHGVARPL